MRAFAHLGSLAFLVLFAGCVVIQNLPNHDTPVRIHPVLGMKIYNQSGEVFTENEWNLFFYTLESAYVALQDCIGTIAPDVDERLRSTPFVILSSRRLLLLGSEMSAFTDLEFIFIRRDRFYVSIIRQEWIHNYLYFARQRWFGDFFHRDSLFSQCKSW